MLATRAVLVVLGDRRRSAVASARALANAQAGLVLGGWRQTPNESGRLFFLLITPTLHSCLPRSLHVTKSSTKPGCLGNPAAQPRYVAHLRYTTNSPVV